MMMAARGTPRLAAQRAGQKRAAALAEFENILGAAGASRAPGPCAARRHQRHAGRATIQAGGVCIWKPNGMKLTVRRLRKVLKI